ncbi:MAG TPA: glucokinase [Rhizobiaceae bacterium]|nr:glucokinase [Rhizobiaceae bacterium]
MIALVCDVGGTNTRFGLVEKGVLASGSLASFRNGEFADFDSLLAAYLRQVGRDRVDAAAIALAAPVGPEGAALTNHDWTISRSGVDAVTRAKAIYFLNDFEALGFALMNVGLLETVVLRDGPEARSGRARRLVLGAGTGFNAAALIIDPITGHPVVAAAECGHMTLPVEGREEHDLQRFLSRGRGRASNERALSGRGLTELYGWCCEKAGLDPVLQGSADLARRALDGSDGLAREAALLFARLLGRVAGDLALAFLPLGGIYLTGGVSRALLPLLKDDPVFLAAFHAKGRMSGFMDQFPIAMLTDDRVALAGCAAFLAAQTEDNGRPGPEGNAPLSRSSAPAK